MLHKSGTQIRAGVLILSLLLSCVIACAQKQESRVCMAQSTLQRVVELIKQHQIAEGKTLLSTLEKCQHLTPIETFNIGWTYGRLHDFKHALVVFARVNETVPDLQTHAYAVAMAQFELGDFSSAIKTLTAVQERQPLNSDCANLLAVSYAKTGRYQDAYQLLQQHPGDLYTYLNLITLLSDTGQFAEALKVATQCVTAFPQNAEVIMVHGAVETLLGKLDDARSDFENAIKVAPDKSEPRFFLALTDYKLNHYDVAAADLRKASQAGIASSDLEYLQAECMLKLDPEKPAEAITELDKAIQLNGNSVPARTLRGKLLLESQNPQKAIEDLEIAHNIDPSMRSATYNLARAYFAVGKLDQAKELYSEMQTKATDTVNELSDQRIRQVLSGTQ